MSCSGTHGPAVNLCRMRLHFFFLTLNKQADKLKVTTRGTFTLLTMSVFISEVLLKIPDTQPALTRLPYGVSI